MKAGGSHLTYCLNLHPGETWPECLANIRLYASEVKRRVSPDEPFGLGLRLSAAAADGLLPVARSVAEELTRAGMYAFTVNAFPYGTFHGASVKERVYLPDWTTDERRRYSLTAAECLAALLPEGIDGSVSTVPVGYGGDCPAEAIANLVEAARGLERLRERTGRTVRLALEPEPDCCLQTAADCARLFDILRSSGGSAAEEFLGVCLDVCHSAVEFREPSEELAALATAGVRVPKIQLSSALALAPGANAAALLGPFAEEVYLHQTRMRLPEGRIVRFADLPAALDSPLSASGETRVHFHVPLHFGGSNALRSTAERLDPAFFEAARATGAHLEIETYTFDVLPGGPGDPVDSVVREYEWALARLSR